MHEEERSDRRARALFSCFLAMQCNAMRWNAMRCDAVLSFDTCFSNRRTSCYLFSCPQSVRIKLKELNDERIQMREKTRELHEKRREHKMLLSRGMDFVVAVERGMSTPFPTFTLPKSLPLENRGLKTNRHISNHRRRAAAQVHNEKHATPCSRRRRRGRR